MRTPFRLAAVLLTATALLGPAQAAFADDDTPSPSASGSPGPTDAGTGFRTATAVQQGQEATADASTGDYLYWMFPAAAGQIPRVTAEVTLPDSAARHGSQTWQLDVFDGLRRRQACASGTPTRTAAVDATTVSLSCRLRAVRAWAEPWANDPLPGAYYVRLTVTRLPDEDLGQAVQVRMTPTAEDAGGSKAVDGKLAAPLTPVVKAGATLDPDQATASPPADDESSGEAGDEPTDGASPEASASPDTAALAEPDGGWGGGWWSDRWIWTVGGGLLAAVGAVGGYNLTRGRRS